MTDVAAYDYALPAELIAQHPLPNRVDARLLVIDRSTGSIAHHHVRDLPELLAAGDGLVLNDTQVIAARLVGHRTRTAGRWQGLFLECDPQGVWRILSKTRGHLEIGETVTLHDRSARPRLELQLLARLGAGQWAARPRSSQHWLALLQEVGRVPLPHYIRGGVMAAEDADRYQTVFARQPGSVAAPTAGLHFTPELLQRLQQAGIGQTYVTLHVGLGTFRPMTVERVDDHVMHAEHGEIAAEAAARLEQLRRSGGRRIAVGTTAVRVLETAAARGALQAWCGQTDLFIRPPHAFRAVDALLTNFHLPKSTLLVLVSAFAGLPLIRRAYRVAIEEEYRFFSYGDAMLIL